MKFTPEILEQADNRQQLLKLAEKHDIPVERTLRKLRYEKELEQLQIELVNLQRWIVKKGLRVAVLFEGRDAAGKGGAIKRLKNTLTRVPPVWWPLPNLQRWNRGNGTSGDTSRFYQIPVK